MPSSKAVQLGASIKVAQDHGDIPFSQQLIVRASQKRECHLGMTSYLMAQAAQDGMLLAYQMQTRQAAIYASLCRCT